ncbi:acyl-CoA dehydrogenase family protein [Agrococcus sp. SCSIO52902]|uniref:acyl-CoA dehydrogenase family protein n=1 Tax=Agrococcus sp. SCSIO52902 TaxID=2933290 RepID=UPI001FF65B45|nr:acyl-CoA dehydrogenase family protein [Agrococcus sp. SCSIO52902]UOW01565.1 acyl-CoA dehydrogenase family protein [Agrococcus sp. SCSIO52902]
MTTDLLDLESLLTDEERAVRARVRALVDREIRPHIADWFERAVFPRELVPALAAEGLLGMHLTGYGCAGRSAVEYGIAMQELEAGDSGIRTFVSVQGSLAMTAIAKHGSEEQRQEWLPRMAAGEAIGCFALTEPDAGSDPAAMRTVARRDGHDWVLDGAKRWIGLASIADLAVVWAQTDEGVRGFLVETSSPGFTAMPIEPKLSMRASIQCDIALDGVRVPESMRLPDARGLRAPFECLGEARFGIAWGALGAGRDALEGALSYAGAREVFGRPLAGMQLTQARLAEMALALQQAQLLALHLGRRKDAGLLRPHEISMGKLASVRAAIDVCREARALLGGNGVTLEHSAMRHAANLESVRTYEGTDEVHTLVIGQALTGLSAFRG